MDDIDETKSSKLSDQIDRFKEAARQLGCDEDEAAFDEKLRQIARQKPVELRKAPSDDQA